MTYPDPLDRERNSVTPFCGVVDETFQDSRRKKLSNRPAKVDEGGKISTKNERAHLSGISRAHRGEDTPWDAAEEGTNEQSWGVWSKESDEDKSSHQNEVNQHDLPVPILLSEVAVRQRTNNIAHGLDIGDTSLPRTGQLPPNGSSVECAILLSKCWIPIEASYECCIITFHDNGCRYDDRPEDGFAVRLDALPKTKFVFCFCG